MSAAKKTALWRLVSGGDGKYRLEDASGKTIAWVRGHAVGVDGFRSIGEAAAAAPTLRRTLDATLAREYPTRHRPVRACGPLRLVHDGAYEWVATADGPLARLHRPGAIGVPNESIGLELVLPSFVAEPVALKVAGELATTRVPQSLGSRPPAYPPTRPSRAG